MDSSVLLMSSVCDLTCITVTVSSDVKILKLFLSFIFKTVLELFLTCRCWCLSMTLWGRSPCGTPCQEACQSRTVTVVTPGLYSMNLVEAVSQRHWRSWFILQSIHTVTHLLFDLDSAFCQLLWYNRIYLNISTSCVIPTLDRLMNLCISESECVHLFLCLFVLVYSVL